MALSNESIEHRHCSCGHKSKWKREYFQWKNDAPVNGSIYGQFVKTSFETPVLPLLNILCCIEKLFCVIGIIKEIKRYSVD